MRRGLVVFFVLIAVGLAGCGGGDQPAVPSCVDASGTWDMGNDGRWTIAQTACEVTLTSSLGLFGTGAQAVAGPTGFSATWTVTEQPCRMSYQLDASVSGRTLRGTLNWASYSYGSGYCPSPGFLTRAVSGTRL